MRRLLAWGRQDPQCPAEAASPPPLSAFHSPSSVLPTPSKLFSDIERQLSARIAAEPLLRSAQPQPSPPTEAASERTSPPEPTPTHSAATDTAFQKAAITDFEHQLQQQQQQQQNAGPNVPTVRQSQPKGIDAFFAALANANRDNGGAAASSTASSVPCQQQQPQQQTKIPFFESEQTNPRHKSFAQQPSVVARMSSDLCPPLITQQQPFTTQPLAQKVQQQMTNNELAANLLVNAIAAQQQQNEMRPSMELLANLKTSHQSTAASHQPLSPLNSPLANSQNASVTGSAALNAFQLVQQTAQFNQQKMLVEQQQRQLISAATMALKSPLSPQGAVFTCSEVGFPGLLNRLPSVPTMFCSSVGPGPSQSKPIPLLDERVDLIQFKRKEPREWSSDDVVAWILDVARRHQIPCENLNLAKFASCTGPLLMLMNEQSFKEHDPNYGSLLFSEFCKLVTDENFIDEWMKANGISAAAGTSSTSNQSMMAQIDLKKPAVPSNLLQQTALLGQFALQQEKHQRLLLADSVAGIDRPMDAAASVAAGTSTANLLLNAVVAAANGQQQKNAGGCAVLSPLNQLLLPAPSAQQQEKPQHSPVAPLQAQSAIASLSQMVQPIQQQQPHQTSAINGGTATALMDQPQHHLPTGTLNLATPQRPQQQHFLKSNTSEGVKRGVGRPAGSKNKVEKQIKRNKDGRPRKRSQHTKGNKLWEFIRDALKDPRTCPSVVRWEDPSEGVFRIVESERLAFLWGQKKNNQKMTYEKLSRAMRTYYEKEILVPVPKSGLYPKKLVYKFGPTAHGWRAAASLAIQAHLALIGGQRISM